MYRGADLLIDLTRKRAFVRTYAANSFLTQSLASDISNKHKDSSFLNNLQFTPEFVTILNVDLVIL